MVNRVWQERGYIHIPREDIMSNAKELISRMVKRNISTVPYVKGRTANYQYEVYDPLDETILLCGINTDSCFRIGGNDNDFLHYCALNKNGFVLKFSDAFGNFIGKASGFRNGNVVYINQLRTVYDQGGNCYSGITDAEKDEIIETFLAACRDILETSQKNPREFDKIEHVITTQSYTLSNLEPPRVHELTGAADDKVGGDPMDMKSDDWFEFINETPNLQEADDNESFSTDFGGYTLLGAASIKKKKQITSRDINHMPVEPVYRRKRNKVIVTDKITADIITKVNRINGLYSYLNHQPYHAFIIPEGATIFLGDNWFIAYQDGKILTTTILDFDKRASMEYSAARLTIMEYLNGRIAELNGEYVMSKTLSSMEKVLPRKLVLTTDANKLRKYRIVG